MSDIMIPGITNSGFDTDSMIDRVMEAERAPLERMEERVRTQEEERAAWQEVGRRISNLEEAARALYGFDNPFNDRVANTTDDLVLTASADRGAVEGTAHILVRQLASADRFISRDLPQTFTVAAGRYGFRVGENEVLFNYSGGSLESFAQVVNQRAGDLVQARVVRNTATTRVLLIEAKATGRENPLFFLEAARSLALSAGVIEEVRDTALQTPIQASTVTGWPGRTAPGQPGVPLTTVRAGTLTVEPGGEASVRFPTPVTEIGELVLELEVRVTNLWEGWVAPDPPPGPQLPDPGRITLSDITIVNEPSQVPLPEWQAPEPPEVRENLRLLYLQSGTEAVPLPELRDSREFVTVTVPLAAYAGRVDALNVRNSNTHREIALRNIRVYDPRSRGDVAPVNALDTASDAILEIDGIRVVRPSNTISDLIPGVTLTLRSVGPAPVTLSVEPDRDSVTDSLIRFVFYYNELLREINILSRNEETIVDEITSFTEDDRAAALARLGMLQGDFTLNRLKSSLQTVLMNAYTTRAGRELSLLAQMGISTNASGPGGGVTASRLRGYLEMNPRTVTTVLLGNFLAARDLFGSDTDGDSVIDSGVAIQVHNLTRPFLQVGGLISTRTGGIATSIAQINTRIEREQTRLERVEREYRADFARMEAAMSQLRESRQAFENLQIQTGSQR